MPTEHPFFKGAYFLYVALSNTCDCLCKGCGVGAQPKNSPKAAELTLKELEVVFKEANKLGIRNTHLYGGEPTFWTGDPSVKSSTPTEQFFQLLQTAEKYFPGKIDMLSNGLWAHDLDIATETLLRMRESTGGRLNLTISADLPHRTVEEDGTCVILDNLYQAIQLLDPSIKIGVQYRRVPGKEENFHAFMHKYQDKFDVRATGVWGMDYKKAVPPIESLPESQRTIEFLEQSGNVVTARPIDGYHGMFEKCFGKGICLSPGGTIAERGGIYACSCSYSLKIGQLNGDHVEWDEESLTAANGFLDGLHKKGVSTYLRELADSTDGPLKSKLIDVLSSRGLAKRMGCVPCYHLGMDYVKALNKIKSY